MFLIASLLIACLSYAGQGSSTKTSVNPSRASESDAQSLEDRTVLAVSKAIRKNKLTSRDDECLAYQFSPNTGKPYYVVDVRENHRDAKCGGDPNTSPRLFTVRVSKKTKEMWTDQGSPSGEFRALPN
jgi:hypothetical protein